MHMRTNAKHTHQRPTLITKKKKKSKNQSVFCFADTPESHFNHFLLSPVWLEQGITKNTHWKCLNGKGFELSSSQWHDFKLLSINSSFHTRKTSRHHTLFIPSHLSGLLWIQVEMCSLTALSASPQTFSLQAPPSDWAFKLKYRRPPTYPACCFLCKWCCVFKNSFILNPYFILPDINPVIFWQQGQQHSRGMPVAEAAFDPSSQPHTWVMMALLVALSLCTPGLSLRTPPMNAVIDGQWRHPCLMCL